MKMLKVKDVRPLFDDCLLRIYQFKEGHDEAVKVWEGAPEETTPYEEHEIDSISGAYEPEDNPYWNIFAICLVE